MLRTLLAGLRSRDRTETTADAVQRAFAARETGDLELARALLTGAIERQPGHFDALCLLADIELARDAPASALVLARQAVAVDPDHPDGFELLGAALAKSGERDAAAEAFLQAIALDPTDRPRSRNELAVLLIGLNRAGQAANMLRWVLKRDPEFAEAHVNLGVALKMLSAGEEALAHFHRAIALRPREPGYRNNLAVCLRELDRHDEAEQVLREALAMSPGDAATITNLAHVLRELGRAEEALALLEPLIAAGRGSTEAHSTFAKALQDLGELDRAANEFEAAIDSSRDVAAARLSRGFFRLGMGDYEAGWRDYESRYATLESPRRGFPFPEWQGEALAGKSLLVYREQGLGDEIMFANCMPDVLARTGACVLECDPRLARLFARSFPAARVVACQPDPGHAWLKDAGAIDFQVAAGSLPHYLRGTAAAFPDHRGYLVADPARVAYWAVRLAALGPGRFVGLAWRGGLNKTRQATRSVPVELLAPLLAQPGVHFVSLQHGPVQGDLARFADLGVVVHHWPDALADYDEAGALLAALDLTVTVCNSVVHLGGSLGREVCVMVPFSPEWRYRFAGDGMPWYPTVRLYRQPVRGDWSGVLAALAGRIAHLGSGG